MRKAATAIVGFTLGIILAISSAWACACCGTYQVVGVASDDVLNIRSGPSVRYPIVGEIPSGSGCVIRSRICQGRWCRVQYVGMRGWVNVRYLRYIK